MLVYILISDRRDGRVTHDGAYLTAASAEAVAARLTVRDGRVWQIIDMPIGGTRSGATMR